MEITAFESLKSEFKSATTDRKIEIYVNADELTQHQYKELLQLFPLQDLNKLEAALA
ncbi:MAG: hypothetical protein FWF81_12720 [Defluviitaleaceae bacterium]|nr:hypothetical protein [Defluviitaleaceae bacterium]